MNHYVIMLRYWNGKDWEIARKDVKGKKAVIGSLKPIIDSSRPYQISITEITHPDIPKKGLDRWFE